MDNGSGTGSTACGDALPEWQCYVNGQGMYHAVWVCVWSTLVAGILASGSSDGSSPSEPFLAAFFGAATAFFAGAGA